MPFAAGATVPCSILLALLLLGASPPCHGAVAPTHDITAILAASPDLADFGAALAAANLTGEIDRKATITVLAVDNAAMERLRARGIPPDSLGHVLSLHVLLNYFDGAKLKALNATSPTKAATLYQASGAAPGSAGMVDITKGAHGRVAFAAAAAPVFYQKSIKESPYDIAVLQVSDAISSPAAEGKAPGPASPPPSPAPVSAPALAPVGAPSAMNHTAPPPKPAGKPAPPPNPAGKPVPPPKPASEPASPPKPAGEPASAPNSDDTPADSPEADNQPPADEEDGHKNAAAGSGPWSLGVAVAVAVAAAAALLL